MTKPGTVHLRYRRGGLCLGFLAALALGGMALAEGTPDAPAIALAPAADLLPAAAPVVAVPVAEAVSTKPVGLAAVPAEERQRRMLMLLLMHSTGPLGPYGALGR